MKKTQNPEEALAALRKRQKAQLNSILTHGLWEKLQVWVKACPLMGCTKMVPHQHQICPRCGIIDAFNPKCVSCKAKRERDKIVSDFKEVLRKEQLKRRGIFSSVIMLIVLWANWRSA
jgi:hypothetical protein